VTRDIHIIIIIIIIIIIMQYYSGKRYKCKVLLWTCCKGTEGIEVRLYSFFDLSTWRGWVFKTTRPTALSPWKSPATHCMGGSVGLRAGLDDYGKSLSSLTGVLTPDYPTHSELLYLDFTERMEVRTGLCKAILPSVASLYQRWNIKSSSLRVRDVFWEQSVNVQYLRKLYVTGKCHQKSKKKSPALAVPCKRTMYGTLEKFPMVKSVLDWKKIWRRYVIF
jgi:hypothetical protein